MNGWMELQKRSKVNYTRNVSRPSDAHRCVRRVVLAVYGTSPAFARRVLETLAFEAFETKLCTRVVNLVDARPPPTRIHVRQHSGRNETELGNISIGPALSSDADDGPFRRFHQTSLMLGLTRLRRSRSTFRGPRAQRPPTHVRW